MHVVGEVSPIPHRPRLWASRITLAAVLVGCNPGVGPDQTPSPALVGSLPTWVPSTAGPEVGCGDLGLRHYLRGDPADPRIAWLESALNGSRLDVVWPAGTTARFTPELEIVDATGSVLMREGDLVEGACSFDRNVVILGWP